MSAPDHYDAIAREYQASKQLPFRLHVEVPTLFGLVGDVRGLAILDLACGEGIYSRQLRRLGAARVLGVDLSPAMIDLAREAEAREPLGCEYRVGDAGAVTDLGQFDLVLGAYLLNYADSPAVLSRFATTIRSHLKPGGRFVGINDNPAQDPAHYPWCEAYGFSKTTPADRREGDPITYTIRLGPEQAFRFDNYYLHPDTIAGVFARGGFTGFRWEPLRLGPTATVHLAPGYWDNFLADPPILGVQAWRA